MKKHTWLVANALLVFVFLVLGNISSSAQFEPKTVMDDPGLTADELRPFDFSDKYYASNGVMADMILNRPNGGDGFSVADFTSDPRHNNVRILATYPAYGHDGETLYWNFYGQFNKNAFTEDPEGFAAYEIANGFPIYMFPGQSRNGDRQAPIIDNLEGYFDKNVLGLGAVMVVEYKDPASLSKADLAYLQDLSNQNGLSADGTPIIRTISELKQLQRRELVSITPRGDNGRTMPFIVGKVIQYPEYAVTRDAFLLYTKDVQENPLASEEFFIKTFTCFQENGRACGQ